MCKACQTPASVRFGQYGTRFSGLDSRDIRRACRESQREIPRWLAPLRSPRAELTYQLNRLARNARFEESND